MKKLAVSLGILVLVGFMVAPVFAHRWGRGGGYYGGPGPGACWLDSEAYLNLSETQRTELKKLEQKHSNDTIKLREQIWTKAAELDNLLNTSEPNPNKARVLQREISDLKAKMAENRVSFQLEARKIAPDARFGRGYGRGYARGYSGGHHHGHGHHREYGQHGARGGYGSGPCWN